MCVFFDLTHLYICSTHISQVKKDEKKQEERKKREPRQKGNAWQPQRIDESRLEITFDPQLLSSSMSLSFLSQDSRDKEDGGGWKERMYPLYVQQDLRSISNSLREKE